MTLRTRLARLQAQTGSASTSEAAPLLPRAGSALRERLARVRTDRIQAPDSAGEARMSTPELAQALAGETIEPGLIRVETHEGLGGYLGRFPLNRLRDIPPLPGECAPPPAIYIDTETTGLAGGSGTLAFLVGAAVVEAESIRLVQLLLTRFDAEGALLSALADLLPPGHRLASFNGKAYDLPLLLTRFRLQGIDAPFAGRAHLDLLHPTRRLFARHWNDCRLTTLERELFEFTRTDDLPGAEAPDAWFRFMRTGRADRLVKVVAHNRQDILTLIAAHRAIADAVHEPDPERLDITALARWLAEFDETPALELLDRCGTCLDDEGLRFHATLLRRARQWQRAVGLWEQLAARGCQDSIERLAKYHEHVSGDLMRARDYCGRLAVSQAATQRRARIEEKLGAAAELQRGVEAHAPEGLRQRLHSETG